MSPFLAGCLVGAAAVFVFSLLVFVWFVWLEGGESRRARRRARYRARGTGMVDLRGPDA